MGRFAWARGGYWIEHEQPVPYNTRLAHTLLSREGPELLSAVAVCDEVQCFGNGAGLLELSP